MFLQSLSVLLLKNMLQEFLSFVYSFVYLFIIIFLHTQAFLHQLNPKALLPHLESEKAQKLERKVGGKKDSQTKGNKPKKRKFDTMTLRLRS